LSRRLIGAHGGIEPDTPDPELLQALAAQRFDWLVSLDANRQPAVWSELLTELADGTGRLIRIKIRRRETPTIPVLTRYWSRNYGAVERLMEDARYRLVQVGLEVTSQREIRGGVKGYTRQQLGRLSQQEMSLTPDNALRRPRLLGRQPRSR
jgi:hypothetical protein